MCSKAVLLFYTVLCAIVAQPATASIEKIETYTPEFSVSDRGALSNDQRIISSLLKNPTYSQFLAAQKVYEQGGSSGPIASVFVPGGVPQALRGGEDQVTADSVVGAILSSEVLEDVPAGGTIVKVRYYGTGRFFETPHLCTVGGLPRNERMTDGCYNGTGTMVLSTPFGTPMVSFDYEYDVIKNNTNRRSIQGFSTNADTLMRVGGIAGNPFYDSFQPFIDFYGRADYADHIIQSAVVNNNTDLLNGNFNMKSAEYGQKAAAQVYFKGTAYVIMSMAILYELESAVYQCDSSCNIGDCNEDPETFSLDEAVAYFRGGEHEVFMSKLNTLRCANFGTCHELPTVGDAIANVRAFELFNEMQTHLKLADCDKARELIPQVASQMWVGVVQGTLRYAWITDSGEFNRAPQPTDIAQAEGAIFLASILPLIEQCSAKASKTLYDNLSPNERVGCDFAAVKNALEECYGTLGITCADVGGLIGGAGVYQACATLPCGGAENYKFTVPQGCSQDPDPDNKGDDSGSILNGSGATSLSLRGSFLVFSGLVVIAMSIGVLM